MTDSACGVPWPCMNTTPHPVRPEEWDELAAVAAIREAWGLRPDDGGPDLQTVAYAARFDFATGGPGYIGDLFLVHDDAFGGPPVAVARNRDGELYVVGGDYFWSPDGDLRAVVN